MKAVRRDENGRYYRNLGYIKSGNKKYSQRKFYLGYDEDHAKLASARLEALWKVVKDKHEHILENRHILTNEGYQWANEDYETNFGENGEFYMKSVRGKPIWTELTLILAEAIRQGELNVKVPLSIVQSLYEFSRKSPSLQPPLQSEKTKPARKLSVQYELVPWLEKTRRQYPMIHVEIEDPQVNQELNARLKQRGEQLLEDGRRLTSEPLTNQKIHHAIGTYSTYVRTTTIDGQGETTEWANAKVRQITFVKNHVPDIDLSQLGAGSIEAFLSTLAGRPITKRGEPCSKSFVKSCNKELKVFLKWLDSSSNYSWNWPVGFEYKPPRVCETAAEQVNVNISRQRKIKTYNLEELSTIYQYATPIQRLYVLLCLNCGFANAEITTLLCDDIFIRQPHPDEDLFRLGCGDEHSWIARRRTKSSVLATWKLWPETVSAIEWWYAERAKIEANFVKSKPAKSFSDSTKGTFLVTSKGKPIAEKNRRTGRIPNSWNSLLDRIQKDDPDFKRLSFKFLRKTGSSFIREESDGELAKVYLSHRKPYDKDENLEDYANRPYRKMFEVLDLFSEYLAPVWAFVDEPFPAGRKLGGQDKVTPDQVREMKKMRSDGVSVIEIANALGVNKSTVYRRTKSTVKPK